MFNFTSRFYKFRRISDPLEAFEIFAFGVSSLGLLSTTNADFGTGLQEAYEEFKRVLLALMYDKDDEDSPVAEEV